MMGLETIKQVNEEEAKKRKLPVEIVDVDDDDAIRKIPHIGSYRPSTFVKVNEFRQILWYHRSRAIPSADCRVFEKRVVI